MQPLLTRDGKFRIFWKLSLFNSLKMSLTESKSENRARNFLGNLFGVILWCEKNYVLVLVIVEILNFVQVNCLGAGENSCVGIVNDRRSNVKW